jgi:dipeptidyl aminopeptidase/acylaminoacyl peptidase
MPLAANTVLGPYQIISLLGEGGMGAVYRAKDTRLGRDVAIKVLTNVTLSDTERLQRFEQEARATGMLNHPNLLTIYDVGRHDDGSPFLVSELLEGETLTSRLARGPLSPRRSVDAALQMAQGLAAAHEKGIIHRDLKPDNIFLTRDGRLKILDFGIAKLTGAASGDGPTFQMAATEPGMVLGTVGYMSPEQIRGESVDQRSDIFSLGAILYEMLSGTRAFKRNSGIETLSAILKEDPPDLTEIIPTIPAALERVVRRCLEKDRDVRFHNAHDLAFHLETLSSMSQGGGTMGGNVPRPAFTGASRATGPLLDPSTEARTARMAAAPTGSTATMPTAATAAMRTHTMITPKKPRISPLLLGLLFVVAVAGAAYGGWTWAHRASQKPAEPQYQRMTFRRGEVRSARFTRDGETIVYSAAWDGAPSDIFVSTSRSTEARALGIPDSEALAVSKSAELAILLRRDRVTNLGTLARVPLAGGMPREIADNVMNADWSPDGANLAVIRVAQGRTRIEYPIGESKYETLHDVRHVRVSPDGTKLAIIEPSRGEYDLAIIEGGKPPVTIARGWSNGATGVAWSPDGKELYVSGTSSAAPPALYAVKLDGTTRLVTRLTGALRIFDVSPRHELLLSNGIWRAALMWKPPGEQNPPPPQPSNPATPQPGNPAVAAAAVAPVDPPERDMSWLDWSMLADLSTNGQTVLFSETREGGGAHHGVYLRRLSDSAPVRLGDGTADALSPDGRWALIHQGPKLVILPTGTGEARDLKIDGSFEAGAAWLPDSRRAVVGGSVDKGGYRLHLIDTLDETAKPLSPENIWNGGSRAFAVSTDGRFVAGMSKEEMIVIYPIDGSAAVPVPGVEKGEVPIQWSADGTSLLVYRPTAVPARVHRVNLSTGARELWKEFLPLDPAGVYKIEPVLVTPDARSWSYNARRVVSDLYVAEGLR